jgi:hypothetical protein
VQVPEPVAEVLKTKEINTEAMYAYIRGNQGAQQG